MEILHAVILGKGEPLLILHGFFGMGDNWKTLANRFSKDYQVHIIDQRNHGRSFHSDDFSYELMVEDLYNYIDFHQLERVNILGHSDKTLLKAIEHQSKRLLHTSNLFYIGNQGELAELLAKQFTSKAFFCNSGAEANEAAIKLARKYGYNQKKKGAIISFSNSFHGRSIASISLGGKKLQS